MPDAQRLRTILISPLMLGLSIGILANRAGFAQNGAANAAGPATDPRIAEALRQVSADRIQATVKTLTAD